MKSIKDQFPIFEKVAGLVYLDNGATRLKPERVLEAMEKYYREYSANIHRGVYRISERATEEYGGARKKVAEFIGGKESEIIFTKGTTESINMVMRGWAEKVLSSGDEILLTEMEHHSNLVPWIWLSQKMGLKLRFIKLGEDYQLDLSNLEGLVGDRTKLVAMTQVSNVLGTVNPIKEVVGRVRGINPEIKVLVDGAQAVAHMPVDVVDLGCDFYAFSGHKMYGPTGIGVLWVREEIMKEMEPMQFGGGMIKEVGLENYVAVDGVTGFEAGTPPIAQAIGLGAAVEFIRDCGWDYIKEQESETLRYLLNSLKKVGGLRIFSAGQSGVVSLAVDGVHPHDVAAILDRKNICVRAGHHCAMPLHKRLGTESTVRVSLGVYNSKVDIDRLIEGLSEVRKIFGYGR